MNATKKEMFIFFIVFESMQVMDLVITRIALLNPLNSELNPFYHEVWFISIKLLLPLIFTLILYYFDTIKPYAEIFFAVCLIMYILILINNIILLWR